METNWLHGQRYQLPDLTRDLSNVGSARDLLLTGMTMAYRSMSWAIDADNPECQEMLQDVTLAGKHQHLASSKSCRVPTIVKVLLPTGVLLWDMDESRLLKPCQP